MPAKEGEKRAITEDSTMLAGQKYLICGLSRLTARVAKRLVDYHAQVTIVLTGESQSSVADLDQEVDVIAARPGEDPAAVLESAGVKDAHCLLALSEDDLENLRAMVAARRIAPDLPAVLRAFDPALAQGLEQGMNIRRAYSVSALAAPAFVAAAFGDTVVETLRLGDGEVPICVVTIRPDSPLVGLTTPELEEKYNCAVIASHCAGGWDQIDSEQTGSGLDAGDKILLGGLLPDILTLIGKNAAAASVRQTAMQRRRRPRPTSRAGKASFRYTRLPAIAFSLVAVLVLSIAVFAFELKLSLVDAVYFVITTATTTGYGDISLKDAPSWLKLFGNLVMLIGGALLGVLFSYLSAIATTERLEEMMGRRAGRMANHIVVAGLGNVGYRVVRGLMGLGAEVAAIELMPTARFAQALREEVPVLPGDARLPENLERASVGDAAVFIACTNNELANIEACLHARRLNPTIRTVARVYEDALAEHLTRTFQIDAALSSSQVAAGAFFGAATDERAIRPVLVGDLDLAACRVTLDESYRAAMIETWRREGVRLIAIRRQSGDLHPARAAESELLTGDQVIVCGPSAAVRELASGSIRCASSQTRPAVSAPVETARS